MGFNEDGDFAARKDIQRDEELTYDYALAESNPDFRMECKCGASNCRGIITGNDWRDPAFRAANVNWMLPRLRLSSEAVIGGSRSKGCPAANRVAGRHSAQRR